MPPRPARPCAYPGCHTLVRDKSGRCEAHPFKAGSFADKRRGTAEERGYGWGWKKLRLRILERDKYLCQVALAEGRIEPAEEVDHIIGKATWLQLHGTLDGVDDPSNLQAIGRVRHAEKTRRENGGTTRQTIGADGWPVDR